MMILKRCFMRLFCRHSAVTAIFLTALVLYVFVYLSTLSGSHYKDSLVLNLNPSLNKDVVQEIKHVEKQTQSDTQLSQSNVEKNISYIKEVEMDLPGNDIQCTGNEKCRNFKLPSAEQAKVVCNWYGSRCKGFVYSVETGEFWPKSELTNKISFSATHELYIKKAYYRSDMTQGAQGDTCALPLDQVQSSADGCRLPELDPNDETIKTFIGEPDPIQCPGSQLTQVRGGVLELTEESKKVGSITSISYQPILRTAHKDWGFELGKAISLQPEERQFKLDSEFIRVELTTSEGGKHVEYHAHAVPRPPEQASDKAGLPLSVVMIGFDSLSAVHFQRALPEAYRFMTDELDSVFLKGYTIVGDGTTPALAAFMTGKFESELPEARREFPDTDTLDRWPHIFKDFKEHGYSTVFSEDCPAFAAFNYRLHGFKEPPTDHFSRYFWQAAGMTSSHCIHSKPQHQIHFDYIKSYFEAYKQQPKFGLYFFTDISHNKLNTIYSCSDDFLALLKSLHEGNLLNDTLLIVMSDHGFRYGGTRATFQGRFEERLPLISLTFPKWFLKQYPELIHNLKENSNIVTSPFDLYATFRHILTYPQAPVGLIRGESLFTNISRSRDCETAGVAEHYCPCVRWKEIDMHSNHVRRAAQAVVDHVNNLTASDPLGLNLCFRLQLNDILAAYQKLPNLKLAQFIGPSDIHGRKPQFSSTVRNNECLYQVQLQTVPGKGLYEASVNFQDGEFRVTGDISRINLYGDQPKCIVDKRPDLRKYCLCKDYQGE